MEYLADRYNVTGTALSRATDSIRRCDLAEATQVDAMLDDVQPDVIVHAAALADVDACERSPQSAYRANVEATRNLAGGLKNHPDTHLIYISTDQVYDGDGPHSELPVSPANTYALTKLWGEDIAAQARTSTVLRCNFFGYSASGTVGLVDAVRQRAMSGQAMTLFTDVLFSPLHIDHLAAVITDVIRLRISGRFNTGASGSGMSKAEFARSVARELELPVATFTDGSIRNVQLTAYRPNDMRMDSRALETALKHPMPSIMDGIRLLGTQTTARRHHT
jgi:dTDP-4-dehydrorhamnose reductase